MGKPKSLTIYKLYYTDDYEPGDLYYRDNSKADELRSVVNRHFGERDTLVYRPTIKFTGDNVDSVNSKFWPNGRYSVNFYKNQDGSYDSNKVEISIVFTVPVTEEDIESIGLRAYLYSERPTTHENDHPEIIDITIFENPQN